MTLYVKNRDKTRQFQRYWQLFSVLVERNLKRRYRGSILGVYWSLLNPIILTTLYTALFGTTFATYYNNSIFDYAAAALTGSIVINFYSFSTMLSLESLVKNADLVNKIRLPLAIFPLSIIGAGVYQLCLGMLPVLIIITLVNTKNILCLFLLFIPLIALIIVCAGIGLLLSALYVFFRDLPYFYELLSFVISISSAIFYPAEIVPGKVRYLLIFNPLLPIIESLRQIALLGKIPDYHLMFQSWIVGLVILSIGWICFRRWQSQFMDLL